MPAVIEHLVRRLSWDELDKSYLRRLVEIARDEDLNGLGLHQPPSRKGDASTASIGGTPPAAAADLVARQQMTACG
ncbi:MAG TPA: nicotinate-nucleotide diphosphorylase (carboxylating), partial [Opitutaceae bacterium]|nr:nicotinate-nucleotide diphosphorylase (carboxylating) [Opitutaceae bacterium]